MNMIHKLQTIAVKTLIVSVGILTLIAVLAIWDVIEEDALWKSLATMGVVAFSSIVIVASTKLVEGSREEKSQNSASQTQTAPTSTEQSVQQSNTNLNNKT